MRTLAATEVKNKLGEALSFAADESLLIEKNGKGAYLVFTAEVGRKMVLSCYANGIVSRGEAMKLLGMVWYGELLEAMADEGIDRSGVADKDEREMVAQATKILRRQ